MQAWAEMHVYGYPLKIHEVRGSLPYILRGSFVPEDENDYLLIVTQAKSPELFMEWMGTSTNEDGSGIKNRSAFFFDINLDPNVMMFASLCNLDNFVDFRLKHCAARIFLCLLAAMFIPVPEPQTKIPTLFLLVFTFFANL